MPVASRMSCFWGNDVVRYLRDVVVGYAGPSPVNPRRAEMERAALLSFRDERRARLLTPHPAVGARHAQGGDNPCPCGSEIGTATVEIPTIALLEREGVAVFLARSNSLRSFSGSVIVRLVAASSLPASTSLPELHIVRCRGVPFPGRPGRWEWPLLSRGMCGEAAGVLSTWSRTVRVNGPRRCVQPHRLTAPVAQLGHHDFRDILQVDVREGDLGKAEQMGAERVVSATRGPVERARGGEESRGAGEPCCG